MQRLNAREASVFLLLLHESLAAGSAEGDKGGERPGASLLWGTTAGTEPVQL